MTRLCQGRTLAPTRTLDPNFRSTRGPIARDLLRASGIRSASDRAGNGNTKPESQTRRTRAAASRRVACTQAVGCACGARRQGDPRSLRIGARCSSEAQADERGQARRRASRGGSDEPRAARRARRGDPGDGPARLVHARDLRRVPPHARRGRGPQRPRAPQGARSPPTTPAATRRSAPRASARTRLSRRRSRSSPRAASRTSRSAPRRRASVAASRTARTSRRSRR